MSSKLFDISLKYPVFFSDGTFLGIETDEKLLGATEHEAWEYMKSNKSLLHDSDSCFILSDDNGLGEWIYLDDLTNSAPVYSGGIPTHPKEKQLLALMLEMGLTSVQVLDVKIGESPEGWKTIETEAQRHHGIVLYNDLNSFRK